MKDAGKWHFELVRFFAHDHLSSQCIEAVFEHTATLGQCEVAFWSYCEPMLNTTGPMSALYKAIIVWAAGYRNQRHSENVRLDQARKRAQVEVNGKQY
jgi:hypothetical protein